MKVYAFYHNPMIEESGAMTISLHLSKEGAEQAMEKHRAQAIVDWKKMYGEDGLADDEEPYPYDTFCSWGVGEIEVLP